MTPASMYDAMIDKIADEPVHEQSCFERVVQRREVDAFPARLRRSR